MPRPTAPSKPRPARQKPVAWKRTSEDGGCTSWWLNRGPLCFCVFYCPPEGGARKATVTLSSWTSDCDEPAVERTERFTGDLVAFLPHLSSYQQALIWGTAERLEATAASVRALLT